MQPLPIYIAIYAKGSQIAYVKSTEHFLDIAGEIRECDTILEDMGQTLTAFQNDLFVLSSNIESIQIKSHLLDTRLKNRTVMSLIFTDIFHIELTLAIA